MSVLSPPLAERNETELERCDRHLIELLQEVRVAQTGVQVLLGFLLMVPLTARFPSLSAGERALYLSTLAATSAGALLLIAPSAQHRILFRCGDKAHIVKLANRYAIAGLVCVALAIVGAVAFVASAVSGGVAAGAGAAAASGLCMWCWYLQPLRRRRVLFRRAGRI
jgi:hypothetical protein